MADAPRFDLLLLGYRNDLARERTLAFLRDAATPAGDSIVIERHTVLPLKLWTGLSHDTGLDLVSRLRELGAQVQLVPAVADEVERQLPPPPSAARSTPRSTRFLILLLGLLVAALAYSKFALRPPIAPSAAPANAPAAITDQLVTGLAAQRLNNEAVALNAARDFAQAAARLRTAVEREPQQAVLRQNLKIVLHNWAIAELNTGHPDAAIGLLEEGLAIEEDAALLGTLGVAHTRNAEWRQAQEALERALQLGAEDPHAMVALGQVYRQQGYRQDAVAMFQRARERGTADPGFSTMLQRLERELDVEWDFTKLRSPHFQIAFADGQDEQAARVVVSGLEDAYFTVGRRLDLFPPDRTPVVLYPSEDFHDITQTPSWTGGVYDGRIKLPVRGLEENSPLLTRTLRHEYAHVLINQLGRGRCPVWLNEGVAIWGEEEHDGERVSWARNVIAGQDLFNLRELEQPFSQLSADRVEAAYAQSYLAVRSLVDRFGARRVRELLATVGEGESVTAAFETVFSVRFAAFEADLIRELTS